MEKTRVILLVEDNEDDVVLLRTAFKDVGIGPELFVVGNGREAIEYLAGEAKYANRAKYPFPVLLLLDLKLPQRDGFAVLEWLKAHPEIGRALSPVVLTGFDQDFAMERAYALGAHSYLVKPVRFDKLRKLVSVLRGYWLDLNRRPNHDGTSAL